MKRMINPLPMERHNELAKLGNTYIEERKKKYADKIKALGLEHPLQYYVAIAGVNGFCRPAVNKSLPEWLQEFLENCYADANDQLQKKGL